MFFLRVRYSEILFEKRLCGILVLKTKNQKLGRVFVSRHLRVSVVILTEVDDVFSLVQWKSDLTKLYVGLCGRDIKSL